MWWCVPRWTNNCVPCWWKLEATPIWTGLYSSNFWIRYIYSVNQVHWYNNYATTIILNLATVTVTADVKKVLSSSSQTILTGIICTFVFFFLGVLVGVLCHRWGTVFVNIKRSNGKIREHPSPSNTPADDAPVVYEEVTTDSHSRQKIELEENVAYGHI